MDCKKKKIILFIILLMMLIGIGTYCGVKYLSYRSVFSEEKKASVRRKVTATFQNKGLNYLEKSKISCYIDVGKNSCTITLPIYNVVGSYSFFWGSKKLPNEVLSGNQLKNPTYFYAAGGLYELKKDTAFYANKSSIYSDQETYAKFRAFNIKDSVKIGKTFFEYEQGIPNIVIKRHVAYVKKVYSDIPWLFVPGKVLILKESTYDAYSIAYGLTQSYNGAFSIIDLKYDTAGAPEEEIAKYSISLDAIIHELAHAWDNYYAYRNKSRLLSSTQDFTKLYDDMKRSSKLLKDNSYKYDNKDGYVSKVEWFAGMVSNYYWHVLEKGVNKPYYGLREKAELSSSQKNTLKTLIEKYGNITKNYLKG